MHYNINDNLPKIEILGIGSAKNRALKSNLEAALAEMGVSIPIEEVREVQKLLKYDIIGIPALVVNGKVIFQKVVPEVEDLKIVLNVLFNEAPKAITPKNILVPIDYSPESENTLTYALALAKAMKAKVNLVHVLPSDLEVSPSPIDNIGIKSDDSGTPKEALAAFAKRVANGSGPLLSENFVRMGFIAEEILALSQQPETDMIVLGATGKGSGGISRRFGKVAAKVARNAHCPVLIVPSQARFKGLNTLVYASDYHPSEEKTLPKVVQFGNYFGSSIHFVHVIENHLNGYMVNDGWPGKRFQFENTPFSMTSVESNEVAEGLNRFAKDKKADLMVMTTGKRKFFEALFHKSMTQKMVYNSKIPLLVMHYEEA